MNRLGPALAALAGAVVLTAQAAASPTPSAFASKAGTAAESGLTIKVLSNRADLISSGDALVQIGGVRRDAAPLRIDVDGRDVTGVFAVRPDGRFLGRVEGLALGPNVLTVRKPDGHGARITITNHPAGGPVFSGEQIQPWVCTTDGNGLGPANDAQCNAAPRYDFFYRSVESGAFAAYDPSNPPPDTDIARTTTDQGLTVPYIIRQETGAQNRGIYRIAVLFDPSKAWEPWAPQKAWNHKLLYPFGGGCGTLHHQSFAQNVQNNGALRRGFMVATSALNVLGENCNTVTSAEAVMMLKERIVERYGDGIRYTIGEGCSGGSIGQHTIANSYPGLLQGLQPSCSFEDVWTTDNEVQDCHVLLHYFTATSPHLWGNVAQQGFVTGHESISSCVAWEALFAPLNNPRDGCALPAEQMYEPASNPTGCRGALQDYELPVWGKRPQSMWIPPEQVAGGFAKWVYDNVGIQYGLKALREGKITTEQFVDLNENVGGLDIDWNFVPERKAADPGTPLIAGRTGRMNDATQLDKVAIIDSRSPVNAEIHTMFHSFAMRERLVKANGHADNHVVWVNGSPPAGSFVAIDKWLRAVEVDKGGGTLPAKIVRNKPPEAVNACWVEDEMITDEARCRLIYPYYGAPRIAAGGPTSHDVMKCRLKPLNRADDYGPVPFLDLQWERLQRAFPSGVCDWSKRGVDQVQSVPWLTYRGGPGGSPIGPAPSSTAF